MISRQLSVRLFSGFLRRFPLASCSFQNRNASTSEAAITVVLDKTPLGYMFNDNRLTILAEQTLLYANENIHVHWVPALICIGACLRLAFLPVTVHAVNTTVKHAYVMAGLKPRLQELQQALRAQAVEKKWTKQQLDVMLARGERAYINQTHILNNTHPLKAYPLGLLQLPFWLGVAFAIRHIAAATTHDLPISLAQVRLLPHKDALADFAQTNFLWIPSLASPDPYYILPVILLTVLSCNLQARRMGFTLNKNSVEPRSAKVMTGIMGCFGLLACLACSQLPSAVGIFWVSTSSFAFLTSLLLRYKKVQKLLRITPLPNSETAAPLRDFLKSVRLLVTRKR